MGKNSKDLGVVTSAVGMLQGLGQRNLGGDGIVEKGGIKGLVKTLKGQAARLKGSDNVAEWGVPTVGMLNVITRCAKVSPVRSSARPRTPSARRHQCRLSARGSLCAAIPSSLQIELE